MSHEFKTPIATINLALDAISNPKVSKTPQKILKYVKTIREENIRMLSQVENVLRISQLDRTNEPIQKTKIDIHKIIKEAVGHIQLILNDKSGKLITDFKAKKHVISGNKNHLVNIIVNLLDNSIKYSNREPQVSILTFNQEENFVLKIKDNGIGMSPSIQRKVFDKFYRAESGDIHNVKGHGLGLAYVKKIVDLHRGKINLNSKHNSHRFSSLFSRLILWQRFNNPYCFCI